MRSKGGLNMLYFVHKSFVLTVLSLPRISWMDSFFDLFCKARNLTRLNFGL
jgi:hypothetical protein